MCNIQGQGRPELFGDFPLPKILYIHRIYGSGQPYECATTCRARERRSQGSNFSSIHVKNTTHPFTHQRCFTNRTCIQHTHTHTHIHTHTQFTCPLHPTHSTTNISRSRTHTHIHTHSHTPSMPHPRSHKEGSHLHSERASII